MLRTSFSGLRFRLMVLVLAAVVPALVLLIITAGDQRQKALADAKENAVELAQVASQEEIKLIKDTRRLLSDPANLGVLKGHDTAGCNRLFAALLNKNPVYTNLGAVDSGGNTFCNGISPGQRRNAAGEVWFQRAVQQGTFSVGNYQINRDTGREELVFAQPLLDTSGRIDSVVFAEVPVTWLNQLVNVAQLPEDWTVALFDQKGTILAHYPNPEAWVGQSLEYAETVRTGLGESGISTTVESEVEDIPRVFGVTALRGTFLAGDVFISVGVPKKFAFAEADRLLRRNLIWLAITTVLAIMVAWVGGDLLVRRNITGLLSASKCLAIGDLTARTGPPYPGGELGQLSRAFDDMAISLEMRAAEADHAEEALEQRVRELTALNQFFQKHAGDYVELAGKHRELLEKLNANPQDLNAILKQAQAEPQPDVGGLLDIVPGSSVGNSQVDLSNTS